MPMPTYRNTNTSFFYATIAFWVIACLFVLSKCGVLPTPNDMVKKAELQKFEKAFTSLSHPEQTVHVDFQKAIGRLTDHSQNCDIFIGEIRSYGGEPNQVLLIYADQMLKDYGEPHVAFVEDNAFSTEERLSLPNTFNSPSQWNIDPANLELPLYLVYIFIRDYNAETNIDCQ